MGNLRVLVSWRNTGEPPKHACSNTLYYRDDLLNTDHQEIADDIAEVYTKARQGTFPGSTRLIPQGWQINVRVYDMADAKPRPIKGEATVAQTSTTDTGPREVALCLSYYGDRNLPSTRGRVYLGPFNGTVTGNMRPSLAVRQDILALGVALSEIGGENISWRVHSTKNDTYEHIRTIWTDDEWDTMRSRQLAATLRNTQSV